MKKAFGIVDLLLAILLIGVVFALMNSQNPIVEEHARLDVQKKQADDMIEQVQKMRELNAIENQRQFNDIDE